MPLSPGKRHLPNLVFLLLVTMGLVFLIFELIQRVWLSEADITSVRRLLTLRDVLTSVLVAFFIGRYLLRAAPPLVLGTPGGEIPVLEIDPRGRGRRRLESSTRWFVQMRWVAVLASGLLAFIATRMTRLLPKDLLLPLILAVGGLAAFNFLLWWMLSRGVFNPLFLRTQFFVDLLLLNVMLHFSGGVENPLFILAVFHVMIAGILLSRAECYLVVVAGGVFFALLLWLEWSSLLPHYTLQIVPHGHENEVHSAHDGDFVVAIGAIFWGTLFLTAFFVTRLADQIRSDERELEGLAAHALSEHRLLENALKTTATGLRRLDLDLMPRWKNEQWLNWFGESEPEVHQPEEGSGDSPAAMTLKDGKIRSTEVHCPVKESGPEGDDSVENRVFLLTTAPLLGPGGEVAEVVELAQEITRRKEEQAKMIRAGQLAAIGELASHIAHEVNNPITIMSAKARLLLSNFGEEVPQKVKEDLGKIIDLSDRVAGIAQGLLSYAKPSPGKKVLLDVRVPLRRAVDLARQRARESGVELIERLEGELSEVRANPGELEQIILNLLMNSLDALPEGGEILIEARQEGKREGLERRVCIDVTDNGMGIPPEMKGRIFEPFFTTKEEKKGTGLGLSICLGLAGSQGGGIEVESEPGKGTKVTVWLPGEARG